MYGMNFLFGNNFGFGGFGFGCCCYRPMPMMNPFMLGAMQGYTSAMCAYSMMGGIFSTPSLANFNMYSPYQNYYNNYNNLSQNPFNNSPMISLDGIIADSQAAVQNLQNAMNSGAANSNSSAGLSHNQSVSAKGNELKSNPDFMYKIQKVAKSLNCNPNDLLSVMNAESGLDPAAENKSGKGAVGLIQFTSVAIEELNNHGIPITKEQLKSMDAVKQLDYVEKYLQIAKQYSFSSDAKLSAGDLYAIIYLPGRANREVLTSQGENYYDWNKGLDINKDGQITKSELTQRVNKFRVAFVA